MDRIFSDFWAYICIAGFLAIVIFFVCRELTCWYFKINKIVSLLEEISAKLTPATLPSANLMTPASVQNIQEPNLTSVFPPQAMAEPNTPTENYLPGEAEICPFCNETTLIKNVRCEHCGKRKR